MAKNEKNAEGIAHPVRSKSLKSKIPDIIMAVFLIILAVVMVYPMLYEVFVSFSDPVAFTKHRGLLWGSIGFDLTAYKVVFSSKYIWSGFRNTIFIMVVGVCLNLVLTSLGAYVLSRKNLYFHRPLTLIIIFTMYFSGGLVPFYLTVRNLGLYNSLAALILPNAVNTYNMILLRSYFSTVPDSLMESVMMDGGGHLTILTRIFIPLCKPAMMVMILYYGVGYWNSWFNAMIFLTKADLYPLQLVLRNLLKDDSQELLNMVQNYANYDTLKETVKAATIIVSTVPFLVIYPFLQKYFESGMMIGSLKE